MKKDMKKSDFLSGVYRSGVFNTYDIHGDYKVDRFDAGSNPDARDLANARKEVHGTYKEGVFRPANTRGEKGYASSVTIGKDTFGIDHAGKLYDASGKPIGSLDRNGRPKFQTESTDSSLRDTRKEYRKTIQTDPRGVRMFESPTGEWTGYSSEELTALANYIAVSNQMLRRLRTDFPKEGIKVSVYETEMPELKLDREGYKLFAGNNAESKDGKEHVVLIDRRLKPHERLAVLTHELSHVHGMGELRSERDEMNEEHDAHLSAINLIAGTYENYDRLRMGGETPSKEEVGNALGWLVGTKHHFGIRDEEIREHEPTIRKAQRDLEGRLGAIIAIPLIGLSLPVLFSSITGNVISESISNQIKFTFGGLFIIGLLASFLWLRTKISRKI